MFCPRCGRPVSDGANFCGGCGLPRAEIDRLNKEKENYMASPRIPRAPEPNSVDIEELKGTINRLEGDLTGVYPVENYTTKTGDNTNKESINLTFDSPADAAAQPAEDGADKTEELPENTPRFTNTETEGASWQVNNETESTPRWSNAETTSTPAENRPVGDTRTNAAGGCTSAADSVNTAAQGTYNYYGQSAYSRQAPGFGEYTNSANNTSVPQGDWRMPQLSMEALTTVDYIWMILISGIPVIGLIYLFYQAFMQEQSLNKRNFARANLIYRVFVYFLGVCLWIGIWFLLMLSI